MIETESQCFFGEIKIKFAKVSLKEKTVEWRHSSTHFRASLAVKLVRSSSKLSNMSKLEIIDKVSGTERDVNKLTTSKEQDTHH